MVQALLEVLVLEVHKLEEFAKLAELEPQVKGMQVELDHQMVMQAVAAEAQEVLGVQEYLDHMLVVVVPESYHLSPELDNFMRGAVAEIFTVRAILD
jgi:hypothetical protein